MNAFLAFLPIFLLIFAMTARIPAMRLPLSSHVALPGAALLALNLQLFGFANSSSVVIAATVVQGFLTSLMPLSIVFGALLLFRTLRVSGAMDTITRHLEHFTPDPILRVLLIAWAFSYLIEGLSGFGTPAALAAPLLVALGFPAIRAAAACLVMNTVPVVFGAVGTPIWFGLGELELARTDVQSLALSAAILQIFVAPVIVIVSLKMLFSWSEIRQRAWIIGAVVASTVLPAFGVALFSNEFPSIVGGICGLASAFIIGTLLKRKIEGVSQKDNPDETELPLWRSVTPLIATVIILGITRIKPIGLRDLLNLTEPAFTISLGVLGDFSISAALFVRLDSIFGTDVEWNMALLYVPFILPFILVALTCAPLLKLSTKRMGKTFVEAGTNLALPAVALAGALIFVKLMMHGGATAPVAVLGRTIADLVASTYGPIWYIAAPVVGVLGSFFSGSATISNLTFAPVQSEVASQLNLDLPLVLALQAIGAAVGNMVCLHNIVAIAAVLGLTGKEAEPAIKEEDRQQPVAKILRMNFVPLLLALIAISIGVIFMRLLL